MKVAEAWTRLMAPVNEGWDRIVKAFDRPTLYYDPRIAYIAASLPCEDVHDAGAPCIRCNPRISNGGYRTGPDYSLHRLTLAREIARAH